MRSNPVLYAFLVAATAFPGVGIATTPTCNGLEGALSVNSGIYRNQIPVLTHSAAFIEVCIKGGAILNDFNPIGGSTDGGNCLPCDTGWVLEVQERSAKTWSAAKMTCLKLGMRLPEFFEFQTSCNNAGPFGLVAMTGNWEWVSNTAEQNISGANSQVSGLSSCNTTSSGRASWEDGFQHVFNFRCAL